MTCSRSATCRRSTRWCRSARCRTSSRGFRPTCCTAATASWSSSASRSIPSSSFRRTIPTPAAPPSCCATTSPISPAKPRRCWDSARTISWSISAPTTARCCRISRTAATACSASSRPTSAHIANQRGIPTIKRYFGPEVAREVKREHGAGRVGHRRQLLRPYRGRACDRRRHRGNAATRRRVHFRIALSHRPARHAAIRHDLSRASALLFAGEPQAPSGNARPRSVPCAADPEPRRLDPRLCGAARHAHRCSDSVRRHARRRAARRGDGRTAWHRSGTT